MSFLDQAATQATESLDKNPMQGATQGVQAGIELAKAQQSWQMQRMELQLKRQALEQQKVEHVTGLFDKAAEAYKSDPALGDVLIDRASKTATVLGVGVDEGFTKTFAKSTSLRDWYQNQLNGLDPTSADYLQKRKEVLGSGYVDPATGQKMPGLASVIGGQSLQTAAEKAAQPVVDLRKSALMAEAIAGKPISTQRMNDFKDASANMQSGIASPELMERAFNNPADEEAQAAMHAQAADYRTNKSAVDILEKKAQTEKNKAETEAIPKRLELEKQKVAIERLRVKLQTSKEALGIVDKSMTGTVKDRESLKDLGIVKSLLVPGATVNQVNLAAQGLERAVTGSSRVAASVYNGIKLQDAWASMQQTLAKWRLGKTGDAQVPNGILKNYQDVAAAIEKTTQSNVRKTVAQYVSGGVRNGLLDEKGGKAIIDNLTDPAATQQFLDSIGYHEPQAAPVDVNLERQRAQNAINQVQSGKIQGVTVDSIKAKFKQKTGQEF